MADFVLQEFTVLHAKFASKKAPPHLLGGAKIELHEPLGSAVIYCLIYCLINQPTYPDTASST